MAFLDHVTLTISAGKGGDGVVRWRREKRVPLGGPYGGDGGDGGDVYIQGVRNLHALNHFRNEKEFKAEDGAPGGGKLMHGKRGDDLVLTFPLGTKVINTDLDISYELLNEGEKVLVLHGGKGGLGNHNFKNSIRRAPEISTPGKKGEFATFQIELQLIADIGLIGFPNAGKSSLLNSFTNATSKVASYAFTTLEPHLGDYHGFVIADIPGLIEGASEGKGLGHNFLRHITRTRILAHLVSAENEDITLAYKTIREELGKYSEELLRKQELVILAKADMLSELDLAKKKGELEKVCGKEVITLSLYDDARIESLQQKLSALLSGKEVPVVQEVKIEQKKIVSKGAAKKALPKKREDTKEKPKKSLSKTVKGAKKQAKRKSVKSVQKIVVKKASKKSAKKALPKKSTSKKVIQKKIAKKVAKKKWAKSRKVENIKK